MAVTYGNKPRIVVEESPWGDFFASLPNTVLSFMQLQNQLDYQRQEKEKDRQFRESQLYLKDLLDTKQLLHKSLLKSKEIAQAKGLSFDPESVTSAGPQVAGNYMNIVNQKINQLEDMDSRYDDELKLAGLGAKYAMEMDTDFNSLIDADELIAYKKANPELLEQLGVTEFPKSLVEGAINRLTEPEVREEQRKQKDLNTAINIMQIQWDFDKTTPGYQEDPNISDTVRSERRQAKIAHKLGNIPAMQKHIIASEDLKSTDPTEADLLEQDQEDADLKGRTYMDEIQDQITRTSDKFKATLAWGAGQDFKQGGFLLNVDSHKANIEKTLENWFTKTAGDNTDRSIRKKYAKYFSQAVGTEAQKRTTAVGKMLIDPEIEKVIGKDDLIRNSFGWDGSNAQEKAAIQVFRTTIDMYNLTSKWSGKSGGGISKLLEGLGISKITGTGIDPWLNNSRQSRGTK